MKYELTSLPTRERGLKYYSYPGAPRLLQVAPHAGAWIEMRIIRAIAGISASLPTRERGLKYVKSETNTGVVRSLPTRERGLKYVSVEVPDGEVCMSLPTRERGLKYCSC